MAIDKQNPMLSSSEKAALKKLKHKENVAKANPSLAAANKASSDAKRERRKLEGTSKSFK
jgi:hypothetical protein